MRDHLLQVQQATGEIPKELEGALDYPPQLEYLLEWFWDLASGRQSGMGANPISWTEMRSWGALTGTHPDLWEVGVLRDMDRTFLEHMRKKSSGPSNPKHTGQHQPSKRRGR